eukprot:4746544-Prymnesium_polylepis.1
MGAEVRVCEAGARHLAGLGLGVRVGCEGWVSHLGVDEDLGERHGEAELDGHLEAVGEGAVSVEREDAKVDVVAREGCRRQGVRVE